MENIEICMACYELGNPNTCPKHIKNVAISVSNLISVGFEDKPPTCKHCRKINGLTQGETHDS